MVADKYFGQYMLLRRVFVCCLVSLLLMSCVHATVHMADQEFKQKHLPFIEDGKTTKEEVLLRLGVPSAQFEGERILTYRLFIDKDGNFMVVAPLIDHKTNVMLWKRAGYSLVLVFDEQHMLRKHSLIEIR